MGSGHGRHDSARTDPSAAGRHPPPHHHGRPALRRDQRRHKMVNDGGYPNLRPSFITRWSSLAGKSFRANFYKCGDKLSNPHFVTWNPVGTEKPDYHRPEYFGISEICITAATTLSKY
ncbi:MAG: carbohydrate-binding family 9-like protein [Marinilabiliales bacterium]|nr:carbohydrate-binding family 9-like protein [Marinilabiliales bacterium]